jgi:uncharacterized protein YeaO (DUF488 family)
MTRMRTKRWNDPLEPDDGHRLLICRYRPRGVRKADETWDAWQPALGPSRALHAATYGKSGPPLLWPSYRARFLEEMKGPVAAQLIQELGRRVRAGERITLLCSSACVDPSRCHRTLLATLISRAARR